MKMYSALIDAPAHTDLVILEVIRPELAVWLQRLGLFTGSHIIRHDEEISYHPARVRGDKEDVIIPAGLGLKILVHTESGERKPLLEMKRKERGHIETMSCGRGCINSLTRLGISEDTDIVFIRALPHMDYITVIDGRERTRLSEGEAARIWGKCQGEKEETQFYFARRRKHFSVSEIIGGKTIGEHLKTHGVQPGSTLVLEKIEQTQELHKPGMEPVAITSSGGLRLYLTPVQAEQIIVKPVVRDSKNHPEQQDKNNADVEGKD